MRGQKKESGELGFKHRMRAGVACGFSAGRTGQSKHGDCILRGFEHSGVMSEPEVVAPAEREILC